MNSVCMLLTLISTSIGVPINLGVQMYFEDHQTLVYSHYMFV